MNPSHPQVINWTAQLRAWARSEQSVAALADELGIDQPNSSDASRAGSGLFRRAEVVDARPKAAEASCRVHLPGGVALELDESVDPHWAAALIQALEPRA